MVGKKVSASVFQNYGVSIVANRFAISYPMADGLYIRAKRVKNKGGQNKVNVFMFSSVFSNSKLRDIFRGLLKNKTIAYIPASYSGGGRGDMLEYFELGFRKSMTFNIGRNYEKSAEKLLFSCDAIHIGGGNTFELNFMLQRRGLIPKLREYVENGGILIGNSAGSIVMCPTIHIAQFADKNELGLLGHELDSLDLVPFDMKPHWDYWARFKPEFQRYQKKSGRPLFCLKESQCLHINDYGVHYYGGTPDRIG
jgi:dipeptidase E